MTKYGMATGKEDSEAAVPNNHGGSDGISLPITGHKLNGNNYLQWSQSVKMYICRKGKDEYLTGEVISPPTGDPKFKKWKTENNIVMSWLVNSMTNEIGENFLLYNTTHDIWDAAKEFYSSKENTSEIFEIETTLHDLHQGDFSVTQYSSPAIGNNWMCSKNINGAAPMMQKSSEKSLKKKEYLNS